MEQKKIAIFCWESLYTARIGDLADAATNLAEKLAKNHEVHFFTRGLCDVSTHNVHYHTVHPEGENIVDYCQAMSQLMIDRFVEYEDPPFDILHFFEWHTTEALHVLSKYNTIFTYYSTEYGRSGHTVRDSWDYREISGKEWYAGFIAGQITVRTEDLKEEVKELYNVPDWKIHVVPDGEIPPQYNYQPSPGFLFQSWLTVTRTIPRLSINGDLFGFDQIINRFSLGSRSRSDRIKPVHPDQPEKNQDSTRPI